MMRTTEEYVGWNGSEEKTVREDPQWFTREQTAEYYKSWSQRTIEEYFQEKEAAEQAMLAETPGDVRLDVAEVHLRTESQTKLTNHNSMLVDLGSRVNVIGRDTLEEFKTAATRHGLETQYVPRETRLHIHGVGANAAICDHEAILPIAVKYKDRDAQREKFRANIADGVGTKLPAILGSKSMQDKDSVIVLRDGKEMLVFPGPGGYRIEWSPGTRLLPMTSAPSGHLVVPCDMFGELPTENQVVSMTFWTDHTRPIEGE